MAISKIATKGKQFYEALKDTEKALKIKDPDKRNNALQAAARKATNADPEARAARKIDDQKRRQEASIRASEKARERSSRYSSKLDRQEARPDNIKELRFKAGGAIKAMKKGGMAMADRAGTRAMDPRMAMAMKDVAKGAAFGNPKTRKKIKEGITGAAKKIKSKLGMKKGGMVSSASKRADGCVTKGRTRGKMV